MMPLSSHSRFLKLNNHHTMSQPTHLNVGDCVPNTVIKARVRDESVGGDNPFTWKDVYTSELFNNKRVVLFALPGAFTPQCSSSHLPEYEAAYDEIKSYGIDEIYCLSVNDAFVMRQWGLHQGLEEEKTDTSNPLNPGNFKKVKLIPDGACAFTRGMGMSCVWCKERGLGERSWRYAVIINNGVIEKLFVEPGFVQDCPDDPDVASHASHVLEYLKANTAK